ncbi:MAG: hypothetical protein GVY22_11580 [Gammaproteobacteria bacterium]|jgi:uncharacterized protein (TIGR02001 family)|nr:hypothetical protein [Gammaproteobacteria bacterium]
MKTQHIGIAAVSGAVLSASLFASAPAAAQQPWALSANIGAVSNYIWRGVTQTGDQAAIQGGIDVAHESGFYAGTWASNIDWDEGSAENVTGTVAVDPTTASGFAEDADGNLIVTGQTSGADSTSPNYELDFYAGFSGAINDDVSYDIGAIYYAYPDGRESDFAELSLSGTFKWFTLGVAYTVYGENDDGLFDDGDLYYFGGADFALPYDFGLSLRAGYYQFENDDVVVGSITDASGNVIDLTESANYWNFGASITRDAGDFGTFGLNWDQNNGDQEVGYDTDPKIWVSWSKEF